MQFRIPREYLLGSRFFRKLLHVDGPVGSIDHFCDVDDLEDITADEFRDFLCVLMPPPPKCVTHCSFHGPIPCLMWLMVIPPCRADGTAEIVDECPEARNGMGLRRAA